MRDGAGKTGSATPCNTIDTLIGLKTEVVGNLMFAGGVRIDGVVNGDITAHDHGNSTLVVSERAQINGNVSVPHVILTGKIHGNVCCSQCIELHSSAEIVGDVHYRVIEMAQGATINGNLVCERQEKGQIAELKPVAATGVAEDRTPPI